MGEIIRNKPFTSSKNPHFQAEAAYKTFLEIMSFLLFYYHFAIYTKYTDKIVKKDEPREPKEAKKACE